MRASTLILKMRKLTPKGKMTLSKIRTAWIWSGDIQGTLSFLYPVHLSLWFFLFLLPIKTNRILKLYLEKAWLENALPHLKEIFTEIDKKEHWIC